MRNVGLAVALSVTLAGCAIQRAQVAQDARAQMVGLSKEQVLGCMGPPANKAAEGQTEVWSYASVVTSDFCVDGPTTFGKMLRSFKM
ncbi:outer membrane protein assembly factor BamE (lipoprotein component of BamABCDE complex) [Bradyrhizobium ottawaense]